ncbi:molybdopterin dinucleotide binding domain-containing protein [Hoeflea ulvae]|uniref:molybdopterin dinucleotide binding domain-containing protein n=1 Tax=Hoeflea ulvae TaxID=2983764 RepID=UPI002D1E4A24|nr:molybdopterin dinucleotide binding domain-containing protein [Hoeflea ulvae]
MPDFDSFMAGAPLALPLSDEPSMMEAFHADPDAAPLMTQSGRIEIFSELVASTGLPGHPAWLAPAEWLGASLSDTHGFQLVANQPRGKLHSQLDFGATSMAGKIAGREVARMNEEDARALGICKGDIITISNARGATLAAAEPSPDVMPRVIQLSTGAWYAPRRIEGVGIACVNGNPNAVTADRPTSRFSQGCSGQLSLVSVGKYQGQAPAAIRHEDLLPGRPART